MLFFLYKVNYKIFRWLTFLYNALFLGSLLTCTKIAHFKAHSKCACVNHFYWANDHFLMALEEGGFNWLLTLHLHSV